VTLSQSNHSHRTAAGRGRTAGNGAGRSAHDPRDSGGFSFPEVLVAILIVGVLAAVAIPSFLSTTAKASDVQAKELVRNAQTTAETIALGHGGYANLTTTELAAVEPTIAIAPSNQHAYLSAVTSSAEEYSLTATAPDGDELTITRATNGTVSRSCRSPTLKTGCDGGKSSSW
jgi:prepilin-type N-terminal cleavage/methylation domain-containing protein